MNKIGWICSYTPEELILAANFSPIKLLTDQIDLSVSQQFLPSNFCPYVKRILSGLLGNSFHDLRGCIFVYSCDAMRRLADVWKSYNKKGFIYSLDVPRRQDELGEKYLLSQLKGLKNFLEGETGKKITDDDLWEGIHIINKIKSLLCDLHKLILNKDINLSFKEMNLLIKKGFVIEKDKFIASLEEILSNVNPHYKSNSLRILIYGCTLEDTHIYEILNDYDADVVLENTCNSIRYYQETIEPDYSKPPLEVIAKRYLYKVSCPRMLDFNARFKQLKDMFYKYNCDGVIFHSLKFCDLMAFEYFRFQKRFKEMGIPFILIEREEISDSSGQIKTRIQAFLELLKNVKHNKLSPLTKFSL